MVSFTKVHQLAEKKLTKEEKKAAMEAKKAEIAARKAARKAAEEADYDEVIAASHDQHLCG